MIKLFNVSKKLGDQLILQNVDLEIREGQTVAIIGASGSGKSSLLYIIGLLDSPTEGDIFIEGSRVQTDNRRTIEHLRNSFFGFIFQFHYLINELSALENIMLPALKLGKGMDEARRRAYDLLSLVGLSEKSDRKPYQLSGGEQQRVAICRAMINEPKVILADEPTGNLDSENSARVMKILSSVTSKNQALIVVTHDTGIAQTLDRQIVIKDGRIIADTGL